MQNNPVKIAIIDDDPFVMTHLAHSFKQRLPNVEVVGVSDPVAPVGYQVYIVDREFDGNNCGQDLVQRIKYLSTQARQVAPHYEHTEVGYNYRLSNLLAAGGAGQGSGRRGRWGARQGAGGAGPEDTTTLCHDRQDNGHHYALSHQGARCCISPRTSPRHHRHGPCRLGVTQC